HFTRLVSGEGNRIDLGSITAEGGCATQNQIGGRRCHKGCLSWSSSGCALTFGGNAEAVRVAVVVGKKELGLAVVSIFQFRDAVPKAFEALPGFMDVGRRPIESNALVVFPFDGSACK